jgi:hypothetical protein
VKDERGRRTMKVQIKKEMEKMNKRKIKLIVDGSSLDTIDLQIQWFHLVKLSWGPKFRKKLK